MGRQKVRVEFYKLCSVGGVQWLTVNCKFFGKRIFAVRFVSVIWEEHYSRF